VKRALPAVFLTRGAVQIIGGGRFTRAGFLCARNTMSSSGQSTAAGLAETLVGVAVPEAGAAMVVEKHASSIMMMPFIAFSILLILIGIIVFSTASSKTPGALLLMFGLAVGGGAYYIMEKTETRA
jgi:hypothetical protein